VRCKQAPRFKIQGQPDGTYLLIVRWSDRTGHRIRTRHEYGTETAAAKAQAIAQQRIEGGLTPFAMLEAAPMTVREALAEYHTQHVGDTAPRSQQRMAEHRRELEALLGDVEVEALTFADLLEYRRARRADYKSRTKRTLSDVTVKKELSHLRAAFRFVKVCDRVRFHVFEKLTRDARADLFPPEGKSAGQVIEAEALDAILATLHPVYAVIVRFLRATGARKGEACGLIWSDVRRDRIVLRDEWGNKTGTREIPLVESTRALLPPRNIDGSALVFEAPEGGSAYHGLGQAWDEARRAAGHPTLRLHDLRHTVATELDEYGDRTGMKAALGMSDATVSRYAEHKRFDRSVALFARAEANRQK
jgi:integrase